MRRAVMTADRERNAREMTMALLAARAPDATICPSEVARKLAVAVDAEAPPMDWREAMPIVHIAVDQLKREGIVRLSWKGKLLGKRAGPYRIGRL